MVHIAFIAMSGVRAASEELNRIGLTMPGFVERSKVIASLPSLGLLTLAGMTPDDEVSYHEIADIRTMGELPPCDVAAIASFSAQIKDAYAVADQYRAIGVRVVLGGLHVTARPDEAAQHADAIVVGEGEITWPQVVADLRAGQLKGRYAAAGREFDLAESPMPRFDLLDIGPLQPAHGPDPAWLPVALRVLRRVDPPDTDVQAQAGRPRDRRDPRDQTPLAIPLHRVRR